MKQNHHTQLIHSLNQRLENLDTEDVLRFFLMEYKGEICFSSSLGAEDQVITQMIAGIDKETPVFTLDTGRMFQETYDLLDITQKRYGIGIEIFFPEKEKVEEMVNAKGINLFYESIENRKLCCHIRKIEPLKRALQNYDLWISGLRREQSITRENASLVEWDSINEKIKINPLINWTLDEVWLYIHQYNIPYNALHDKGYPSIGCLPCTRAVEPGEDIRAGRWWWEQPEYKECGLHRR